MRLLVSPASWYRKWLQHVLRIAEKRGDRIELEPWERRLLTGQNVKLEKNADNPNDWRSW